MNLENASFEEIILDLLSQDFSWLTKDEIIGSVNGQLGRLGLQKRLTGNFFDRAVKKLLTERKIIISKSRSGSYFSCDPSRVKSKQSSQFLRNINEGLNLAQRTAPNQNQPSEYLDTESLATRLQNWAPVKRMNDKKHEYQASYGNVNPVLQPDGHNFHGISPKSDPEVGTASGPRPIHRVSDQSYWIN